MEMSEAADVQRCKVSFRIYAPGLNPTDVTRELNLIPSHIHLEGDHPRGNSKYAAYKHGMWSLKSKLSVEQPLEAHLEGLLEMLEPKQNQIRRLSEQAIVDFYCGLFSNVGFQLSPEILERIAGLKATLSVASYP